MNEPTNTTSRRDFIKTTGRLAAVSALAGVAVPYVHAGTDDTIQVALIGCGGRGTGAAANAMSAKSGPVKLVAMADIFEDRLNGSHQELTKDFSGRMDVPANRQFLGFDAYQHAMDCLKPGDVAIFTTPLAFRGAHFAYAIDKGLNVFMEKPLTADGPTTRKMIDLGEQAKKKNLKVGVGLMCRHCRVRHELMDRINDDIGEIIALQAYREHGAAGSCFSPPKPSGTPEVAYQIRRFHSFIWASGGLYNDFYIHNIDECCWAKKAWPVKAEALGGRHYRGENVDQNFDHYSVEYTFADGTKLFLNGRTMDGCPQKFCSFALGTKGMAVISTDAHTPAHCRTYRGYAQKPSELIWSYPEPEPNPYQTEWDDLIEAIRGDKPYNEVERGAKASLVCNMGRIAAHTGQVVQLEDVLNSTDCYAPGVENLTMDGPAPLMPDGNGRYPIPQPGVVTKSEYPMG